MDNYPPVLDVTCGGRMMWFDHNNPLCLFLDNRSFETTLSDGREFMVKPDIIADFRNLPFPDNTFRLVVFDPPHLRYASDNSWLYTKYGRLHNKWQEDMCKGVNECMRVLMDYGVLIFKWSEIQIPVRKVLAAIGRKPLFGHISGKSSKTHWMTFIKIPTDSILIGGRDND